MRKTMKKIKHLHVFKNKFQLMIFFAFWLCYFIINVVITQFFNKEAFQVELLIHSLLYSVGGFIFSFTGYWSIKKIRSKIKSNLYFVLLSILFVYIASFLWAISDHLSWWIVSGDEVLIIRFSVYPIKALMFSSIILAAILSLILTEIKVLSELTINRADTSNFNISNVENLFDVKEPNYEETILLPVRNKILKIKIDSIKLIQANDYYSNVISKAYDKAILSKYPLKKWEFILPKKHFLRVHRSSIVNLNYIDNIEKMDNNTYEVKINGLKQNVSMSRRCAKTILDSFQL
jgi:DNA-binding LytR/AlgR family response regulator